MHTILVPFDGSGHALKALRIACDLSEKYGARIALFHALARDKQAVDILRLMVVKELDPEIVEALQKVADSGRKGPGKPARPLPDAVLRVIGEKILSQAAARVQRHGLEVETLPMEAGDPAESILLAARQTGANTIVMGCRGVSDDEAATFGSVSHIVFQKADCTCISVK
jgi:nucleotide-binding universal stress UspA family protein